MIIQGEIKAGLFINNLESTIDNKLQFVIIIAYNYIF